MPILNNHELFLYMQQSLDLRRVTAKLGMNNISNTENIKAGCSFCINIEIKQQQASSKYLNNLNHQYSDLEARSLNTAYFLNKQVEIDSLNVIFVFFCCYCNLNVTGMINPMVFDMQIPEY